jgi:hypothetical protein
MITARRFMGNPRVIQDAKDRESRAAFYACEQKWDAALRLFKEAAIFYYATGLDEDAQRARDFSARVEQVMTLEPARETLQEDLLAELEPISTAYRAHPARGTSEWGDRLVQALPRAEQAALASLRETIKQYDRGALKQRLPVGDEEELDSEWWTDCRNGLIISGGHVTHLTLRQLKCEVVPEEVAAFTSLISFDLFVNKLVDLPPWLGNFTSLESLDIGANQFSAIPEVVRNFRHLRFFNAQHNQITELPDWFGELNALEDLSLNNNRLTTLPLSITNLRSLKYLLLVDNPLESLPDEFLPWFSHLKNNRCRGSVNVIYHS